MSLLTSLRIVAYSRLKRYPAIFLPIARLRENYKKRVPHRGTDVVLEGYTRSGNHPALFALIVAQPKPLDIAHHFHAPAPLMLAARWGIPAILVIREPIETVASATIYLQQENPTPFLRAYINFYEPLVPYIDKLVISDFPQSVGDFGLVIEEANRRFGRQFGVYRGTPDEKAEVERLIREEHESNMGADAFTAPLPSAEKASAKKLIAARIKSPQNARLLAKAERLYGLFAAHAVRGVENLRTAEAVPSAAGRA